MPQRLIFELVSPEKLLFSGEADMVAVPGESGYIGVLPEHAPLIALVGPGVIRVYENDQVKHKLFVAGGFVEVTQERCTMLAEEAIAVNDIDKGSVDREIAALRAEEAALGPIPVYHPLKAKLAVAMAKAHAVAA